MDDLKREFETKKLEISREAVISTLIGLEQGVEEVMMEVQLEEEFVTMEMYIRMEDYMDTFEKNKDALIQLEEYELLSEVQTHMG
tara:strand:+ start:248 stop:502 length:255 start_codon:yes stop_codon:yes gene_type:complete